MIVNSRFDAGRFRPPADDAVGVLLEEGIGGKLTGLAAGAAEEPTTPGNYAFALEDCVFHRESCFLLGAAVLTGTIGRFVTLSTHNHLR